VSEAAGDSVLERLGDRTKKRSDAIRRAEQAREEVRHQQEEEEEEEEEETRALVGVGNFGLR
jgi:ribosomal protein L12E/L44/L45/RPP1/RPP2